MSLPRRRIVRPHSMPSVISHRAVKLRTRLEREQRLLTGWMIRLKRAFHSFEKYQRRVAQLERAIRLQEQPHVPHH